MADHSNAQPESEKKPEEDLILFEDEPYQEGFNASTIWGALFVGFIMLPGAIYLGLVTGSSIGGAAEWVTIILFVEIAKRNFITLRRQEIIILYTVIAGLVSMGGRLGSGVSLFGGPFGSMIWDQYLVQSPLAQGFGIADQIPAWVAPAPGSEAYAARSFLHSDWLMPIGILTLHLVLSNICGLSMGYAMFRITSDIERLPFPMAPVHAGGATALAESSARKETWRWRCFSIGAMFGLVWGFLYAGIPVLTGTFLTEPIQIIPIPWWDLTDKVATLLPAAPFGITLELGLVFIGFVLPFWIVVGGAVSAVLSSLVLNPILYRAGFLTQWREGMKFNPTVTANSIDFWLSVSIGFAWVVALIGIGSVVKALFEMRKKMQTVAAGDSTAVPPSRRGDIPITLAIAIWAAGTLIYIFLCDWLIRKAGGSFSLRVLFFFGFIFQPLFSYVHARMIGLTGFHGGVQFPFLREGTFLLWGQGASIWFAPVPMNDYGSDAQGWKMMELTRTKFVSRVKASFATLFILLACSFIFWSIIWKLAPVPSSAYPYVQEMWPFYARFQCLWVSSTLEKDIAGGNTEKGYRLYRSPDGQLVITVWNRAVTSSPTIPAKLTVGQESAEISLVYDSQQKFYRGMVRLPEIKSARELAGIRATLEGIQIGTGETAYGVGKVDATRLLLGGDTSSLLMRTIKPRLMVYGGLAALLLYGFLAICHMPILLFYGMVGGVGPGTPGYLPMLLGAILGRFYFRPRFGEKKWAAYTPILAAGYACGAGLVGMACCGVALIGKAISEIVF